MSKLALKLIAENKKTKAPFLDLGKCGLENYLPDELWD
jgi:internalin A